MKIYGVVLSPYVRKVKMALDEKGVDYELVPTDTVEALTELHRLNPRGEVPTVVDGDVVIGDSTIALQYIEEAYPDPPLLPADPAARAAARALEDLGDRLGDAIGMALAMVFMLGEAQLQDQVVPAAKRELDDLYAHLDAQLGTQEYLCGAFSWADLSLIPHVSAAQFFQLGPTGASSMGALAPIGPARLAAERSRLGDQLLDRPRSSGPPGTLKCEHSDFGLPMLNG